MMRELEGQVAVVTGGATGIGLACAELLADNGATVVIADIKPETTPDTGRNLHTSRIDLASTSSVEQTVAHIVDQFGRIDILVNNAAIYPASSLVNMDDEMFFNVMDINVHGVVRTCRAIVPVMLANGGGRIINISSGASLRPHAGLTAYSASKGALDALSKSLAQEVAPTIRVNIVSPGPTETATLTAMLDQGANGQAGKDAVSGIPLERMALPEEIAQSVLFLATERSSFITGATICVNGGTVMH